MTPEMLIENLNAPTKKERLESLSELCALHSSGKLPLPEKTVSVNNHIHTIYSFSPYSPTKAVYMSYIAGLATAGVMDHDSIAGAEEFLEAAKIAGIGATVGFETRVRMVSSSYYERRFNNPDQTKVAYVTCHGVPHQNIKKAQDFMAPYRARRNERNKKQVARINELISGAGITLDFEKEVMPISMCREGGSVTERHILFALSQKLINEYGKGEKLVAFLKNGLKMELGAKLEEKLLDVSAKFYDYNLLGVLKSNLVPKFFIEATDECPTDREFVDFVREIGAISAYAYLGDVGNSVTGDKKAQKFEDDFLDGLLPELKETGFDAVTFMPTRNTPAQLERLMAKCREIGFFQICGEDVNSPHQSFICKALEKPEYSHLINSTWALIGHEKAATLDLSDAMFSERSKEKFPLLSDRIAHFEKIGKE